MANGLMSSLAGDAPPAPGPGGAPGAEAPAGISGEEKDVYLEFLGNTVNAIYDPKTSESVGETLRAAHQSGRETGGQVIPIVEPLAQVVSAAVSSVAYSGLENGLPITRDMAAAAAASLAADIGNNMTEAVGTPPLPQEMVQAVYLRSMELMGEQRDQRQAGGGQQGEAAPAPGPAPRGNGLMAGRAAGEMQI